VISCSFKLPQQVYTGTLKQNFGASMSEVEIVSSEINTTEISAPHGIGPSDGADNSQSKAQDNPRIQPIPFDASKAGKLEVDPVDLVGKVFTNAYHISAKPDVDDTGLPASFGLAFTDGSRYHVRVIRGPERVDMDVDIDVDDLAGKQVTAASLLRCEGHFTYHYPSMGLRNDGMMDHVALGIKVEGSDEWVKFIATEEEYDSDLDSDGNGPGIAKREYHDVFLVKMSKKTRSRKH